MKIGIDARLWNQTGVGRYIRNLVFNILLIDKKNEYYLFAGTNDNEEIKNQISKIKNIDQNFKIVNTDIHWHTIEEQILFPRILEKEKLDLMHFTYFSVPIFYQRPYVVTIHDLIINHFPTGRASSLPLFYYYLKRAGYKYILAHAISRAKQVIVPLNTVKADLIDNYKVARDKTIVTYEGADEFMNIKDRIIPQNDQKYFFYAGNAYPHKNLENLLKGFRKFREKNKNIKMILAGREDYFYLRLREQINREDDESIIFKFNLSDAELAAYYRNSLAYCSASRMEGFGLTPIEAASCGTILVLSDIPAFREIWNENALYFDQENIDDLADKLDKAFKMAGSAKDKLIKSNIAKVKTLSWAETAKKTLKIYEDSVSL